MAYEVEASLFSKHATRSPAAQNTKTLDREIMLVCKSVTGVLKQTMLDYLYSLTTVTDYKYDNGQGTLSGVWRTATSGWDNNSESYYLVLRRGWSETVSTDTALDDEWIVAQGSDTRSDARSYTFIRRNVSSAVVNAVVSALRTTLGAVTNPNIQGEQKTGTFAFASIEPQQREDGSYNIVITAVKATAITAIADLAALTPLRADTHDILNPFGLEGGYATHVGKTPVDGIVLTYRAITTGSRAVINELTDANFQGLLSVAEQAKYEFTQKQLTEDSGNVLTLKLAYQYVPLTTTVAETSARLVGAVRFNQSGKLTMTRSFPRIDPSVVDTLIISDPILIATTITSPKIEGKTYAGDWLVLSTKPEMTENNGARIVQELIKSGDQQLYTKTGQDGEHLVCEFNLWDASVTAVETFLADNDPFDNGTVDPKWATPETGITKLVKRETNPDRSINLYAVYATTADLTELTLSPVLEGHGDALNVGVEYSSSVELGYGFNIPVASLAAVSAYYYPTSIEGDYVPTVNTKRRFEIKRRDEKTFDFEGRVETFYPYDSDDRIIEDTAEKTVTRRQGKYQLAASLAVGQTFGRAASPTAGTVVEIDPQPNDVGSFTVTKLTTVYHDRQTNDTEKSVGVDTAIEKHSAASAAATDGGQPVVGKTTAVENDHVPGGLFKTKKSVTTASDQAGTGGTATIRQTRAVETHTAAQEPMTVGAAAVNVASEVEQKRDPKLGTYAGQKATVTDLPYTPLSSKVIRNDGRVVESLTIGLAVAPGDVPAATTDGESVIIKAVTDKGAIDYEKLKRVLADDLNGKIISVFKSQAIEVQPMNHGYRLPCSVNDDGQPTGWAEYMMRLFVWRRITVEVKRQYYLTHPKIVGNIIATPLPMGGGTTESIQVIDVAEGLWAAETKTITAEGWSRIVDNDGKWDRANLEIVLLNWYSIGTHPSNPNDED